MAIIKILSGEWAVEGLIRKSAAHIKPFRGKIMLKIFSDGESCGELRISSRASKDICTQFGIDLNICRKSGKYFACGTFLYF